MQHAKAKQPIRRLWLQSMTPAKLAAAIEPYLPEKPSSTSFGNDS